MTQSIGRIISPTTKVIGPTNFHVDSRSTRLDYNQVETTFKHQYFIYPSWHYTRNDR